MEELGDARLRCDQLMRYLNEATQLIDKSSHRDHFFEVAGHLIQSLPETAFKLQKALQAVALAADRIDYEEIKQELRPEKVEELERVLKDVRIRQVPRRSENPMKTPKQAAEKLREFAKLAREEGAVPYHELVAFIHELDPTKKAHEASVADQLDKIAEQLDHTVTGAAWAADLTGGKTRLAGLLGYLAKEAEYDSALKMASAKQAKDVVQEKQALATMDEALVRNFEFIRKFAISAARDASVFRWRRALLQLAFIVDEIGTILVQAGSMDTLKAEALKREIRKLLPHAAQEIEDKAEMTLLANTPEEARRSRFEQNVPADPTQNMAPEDAKEWEVKNDEHEDKFKKEAKAKAAKAKTKPKKGTGKVAPKSKKASENEDKQSRHEEGKPADPTLDMSPEDAKEWDANTEDHKDNFKGAAEGSYDFR